MSAPLTEAAVKQKIKQLGLRPSRGNGQNFLIDNAPLHTIITAGDVRTNDRVLEIGPGLGALTHALLDAGAQVTAIEFDAKLAAHLSKVTNIIHGDALTIATPEFLQALQPYKLIANIPYHITSDIIRHFIETSAPPTTIVLLIQKEVAERLVAAPPRTNILALITQWLARIEYIATVSRSAFMPQPEVDSAIVRLTPGAGVASRHHLTPALQKQLFSLIKQGFAHPRKQLRNNLSIKNTAAPIDLTRRAETLTHEEWINLLNLLS